MSVSVDSSRNLKTINIKLSKWKTKVQFKCDIRALKRFNLIELFDFNFRRAMSGTSGTSSYSGAGAPVDEFDRAMQDISHDLENMQMSVHVDSSANSDSFLPKTT